MKRRQPNAAYVFMICHTIGCSPIGTIGFGRSSVTSRSLVPFPPQRIITAIMLTLLALMLDNAKIAVVGSVVMALFLSFVHGITQLAVVRDYRAPHRYLSVDGILHICLTIVIALASVLYLVSQAILSAAESASSFDFRYVVAVFIFIVADLCRSGD